MMAIDFDPSVILEKIQEEEELKQLEVTDEQAKKLARFSSLLLRWNAVYNLTSIKDPDDVVKLHIIDSLTLVKHLDELAPAKMETVLDVGSGGGLPAIPLAIMRPDLKVTMVDAVQKKIIFLRQVCGGCRLTNAQALHLRVEQMKGEKYDVITSRAFSSLKTMVTLTRHLLAEDGRWIAMKGKFPESEIQELPEAVKTEKEIFIRLNQGELERVLIGMKRIDSL